MIKDTAATFLLRMSPTLKAKAQAQAEQANQSLNGYIITTLQKTLRSVDNLTSNLNNQLEKTFIGQVITRDQIDDVNGLVKVNGNLYRCLIEGNKLLSQDHQYVVFGVTGNILVLHELIDSK